MKDKNSISAPCKGYIDCNYSVYDSKRLFHYITTFRGHKLVNSEINMEVQSCNALLSQNSYKCRRGERKREKGHYQDKNR